MPIIKIFRPAKKSYIFHIVIILSIIIFSLINIDANSSDESISNDQEQQNQVFKKLKNIENTLNRIKFDNELNKEKIELLEIYVIEGQITKYLLPVFVAILTAVLTYYLGYKNVEKRMYADNEKRKIDEANKVILKAITCFNDLIGIKDNYRKILKEHPIQRLLCVPTILMKYDSVFIDLSELHYLTKVSSKYKHNSPANIVYINLVFTNFNALLDTWKQRNQENILLLEKLMPHFRNHDMASFSISPECLISIIGKPKLAQLIDLNEHCISNTDKILLQFRQIFSELPDIAEPLISKKMLKSYSRIFRYNWNPQEAESILKIVPVDEELREQITK